MKKKIFQKYFVDITFIGEAISSFKIKTFFFLGKNKDLMGQPLHIRYMEYLGVICHK